MSNWAVNQLGWSVPTSPQEAYDRAERAFHAGNYDEASGLYRYLLDNNHTPGLMLYRLGMIANARDDYDAAWSLHHRALAVDPALAAKITPADFPHHGLVCRPTYDTEEVEHCPVCGQRGQTPLMVVSYLSWSVYHPSYAPVRRWVRCDSCGHGFANPRPTAAAIKQAFQDPAPAHLLTWAYDKLTLYSDIIHDIWQRLPGGDFLDVGVASGGLASVAGEFGYRAAGIDIHPAYSQSVRQLGVEFIQGDIATHDFGGRQFDIIALGDVIEHVADPIPVVANVVTILKPGGLIWLSTPNHEGTWTRAVRDKDPMWREGEHLHFFCRRSFERLLNDRGLKVVDFRLSKRFIGCMEVIAERS